MIIKNRFLNFTRIILAMFFSTSIYAQDITVSVSSHSEIADGNNVQVTVAVSGIPSGFYLDGYNGALSWDNRYLTFVSASAAQGVSDFTLGTEEVVNGHTSGFTFMGSSFSQVTNGLLMTWTFTYDAEGEGSCAFVRVDDGIIASEWTNSDWVTWTAALIDGEICGTGCTPPSAPTVSNNGPVCSGDNAVFTINGTPGNIVSYTGIAGSPASPVTIGTGGSVNVTVNNVTSSQTITITEVSDGECTLQPTSLMSTVSVLLDANTPVSNSATSVTSNSFIANWSSAPSATTYYLDVSEQISFASMLTGYNNKNVGNTTSHLVEGLNENTTYYYRVRAGNNCGISNNSQTITVQTDFSTGIVNLIEHFAVEVFPNPVSEVLNINILNADCIDAKLSITDINGRIVKEAILQNLKTGENLIELPVDDLRSGLYILTISKQYEIFFKNKFIIE